MKKIYCPFCHQEVVEEVEPTVVHYSIGTTYTCYKRICRNAAKHNSNGNIVIPYRPDTKK